MEVEWGRRGGRADRGLGRGGEAGGGVDGKGGWVAEADEEGLNEVVVFVRDRRECHRKLFAMHGRGFKYPLETLR